MGDTQPESASMDKRHSNKHVSALKKGAYAHSVIGKNERIANYWWWTDTRSSAHMQPISPEIYYFMSNPALLVRCQKITLALYWNYPATELHITTLCNIARDLHNQACPFQKMRQQFQWISGCTNTDNLPLKHYLYAKKNSKPAFWLWRRTLPLANPSYRDVLIVDND